jgi:hypothetical protein
MSNQANLGGGSLKPFHLASLRGLVEQQQNLRCEGRHEIYIAEVLYVAAEGKLVVVTVCRSCDRVRFHEQQVAQPHHSGELLKEKGK